MGSSCVKSESEGFILYVAVFDREVWCDKKIILLELKCICVKEKGLEDNKEKRRYVVLMKELIEGKWRWGQVVMIVFSCIKLRILENHKGWWPLIALLVRK